MTDARPVRPTDLVALVSFDGKIYPNEAHTWERLGRTAEAPSLIENAFEQLFSFATGRHTWISIQGQTIRGVVSARHRGSRQAWEVDCLIIADEQAEPIARDLLDRLCNGAVRARTLRIFLRAEAGSDVVPAARQAGFVAASQEWLLQLDGEAPEQALPDTVLLRERGRTDGFPLFRLYNLATPVEVRQHEGMTYSEWIASQEKRSHGRGKLDLVVECGGTINGWLRAVPDGKAGRIDLLLHPEATALAPGLISHAARALGERRPLHCLVPSYQGGVAAALEEAGFRHQSDYISLVKRLVMPVREAAHARVAKAKQPLVGALIAPSGGTTRT